jgi:hypothetical protein
MTSDTIWICARCDGTPKSHAAGGENQTCVFEPALRVAEHGDMEQVRADVIAAVVKHFEDQRGHPPEQMQINDLTEYADAVMAVVARIMAERDAAAERTESEQFDQVWSALCDLVALKDGPRDAEYHRRKPLAWQRAREALTSSGRRDGQITTTGLSAHPLRSAAGYPHVQGRCPACGRGSLFLASGGYLTCASLRCTDPTRASNLLHADALVQPVAAGSVEHSLERKPPDGGGGHTPGVGWMCTGCEWRFSYDVPQDRARTVWLADARHAQNAGTKRGK